MEKNEFYKDIIVKFLQNNTTENEVKLLKDWIAESEENQKSFESFQMIWSASELVWQCNKKYRLAILLFKICCNCAD